MSDDGATLVNEYDSAWMEQANFRNLWQVAAQFCLPAWDNFIGEMAPGVNRNTRIFDSTGVVANERFAAAMESILTPRTQTWHKLVAEDDTLADSPAVQRYLDTVNKRLFAARYHPEANYASQTDECYMSLGAFGNDLLFIDEAVGRHLRYRAWPLSEFCWALNHQGQVDSVYRKFRYTARQALQQWGDKAPQIVRTANDAKQPFQKFEFLHVVKPNAERVMGAYGARGMKFDCFYVSLHDRSVIERSGYRTFPCAIGRYRVAPREVYGRGPATTCLPDVRTSNEMVKTMLRSGQKAVDPPILLAEDGLTTNFNQRPGANNYNMVTADGKPLAIPFEARGNYQLAETMLESTRSAIRDTFLNTLFQILVQNPNMTATEALLRAQEKGELIAPAMGRQQSEFLGVQIHREIQLLEDAGQLPPVPPEMLRSGRGFRIEFTSPMARALRAEEGTAIMNSVSDLAQMANLDPSVTSVLDMHLAAREMITIRGTPAKVVRSEEQVQAIMEQQAQERQQQQLANNAPQVAMGIKNMADAQKSLQASGGIAPPGQPVLPGL